MRNSFAVSNREREKKEKMGDRHCPKPIPREIPQIRTFLEPWSSALNLLILWLRASEPRDKDT